MTESPAAGLQVLLSHLGLGGKWYRAQGALLILAFEVAIIGSAVAEAFLERSLQIWPPLVLAAVWIIWTGWHSWLFPRNRRQYLRESAQPYRRAFLLDIFPWVSIGFSQMWRPLINGDNLGAILDRQPLPVGPAGVGLGLALGVAALLVMIHAIRTIGIHNAAFLREFTESEAFVPIRTGIYGRILHPLFWSGILFSVGLAVAAPTMTSLTMAGINLVYGVLYNRLENIRLSRVYGPAYRAYISEVPSIIPRRGEHGAS